MKKRHTPWGRGSVKIVKLQTSRFGKLLDLNRSTVAHWYAICFVPGGPRFKSRQWRELFILNKNKFNNLNLNTQLLLSNSSKNLTLILKNSADYSIFDIYFESSN